jgi:hypothetical protein
MIKSKKMENKKYHTVETIPKSNIKIVERGNNIPNTQYMAAYCPGLVQELQ